MLHIQPLPSKASAMRQPPPLSPHLSAVATQRGALMQKALRHHLSDTPTTSLQGQQLTIEVPMDPQYEAPPLQQTTWLQSPKPAVPTPRPETGTRLGPDYQAVIPPCEPCRAAGEERLLLLAAAALPGPDAEEALRLAVTEEKRAADSLPLDAVYDWDDPQGGCLPAWPAAECGNAWCWC
jgi:hypothetical protein